MNPSEVRAEVAKAVDLVAECLRGRGHNSFADDLLDAAAMLRNLSATVAPGSPADQAYAWRQVWDQLHAHNADFSGKASTGVGSALAEIQRLQAWERWGKHINSTGIVLGAPEVS